MASGCLKDLSTPCFLVDLDKVRNNAERMRTTCQQLGVTLRAHTKTHKTLEGAEIQTGGRKKCIVVSTLAEAEFYAENGFDDILLAHPITEGKIKRCLDLVKKLEKFHVFVSNFEGLDCLEKFEKDLPRDKQWSVVIELDTGYGRTGFVCNSPEAMEAVERVTKSKSMRLEAVYNHCGNSYNATSAKERIQLQGRDIISLIDFKARLLPQEVLLGTGSTPTCSLPIMEMKQLDEFHPGNYIFYDYQMLLLNACRQQDIACRVMTRVIDHKPEHNMIVVDCGFTALSHDGMMTRPTDFCVIEGHANLRLVGMSQEVGKIRAKEGDLQCDHYPIGTILFLLPYHSCATAAMHQVYHVHCGDTVVARWKPVKGW